MARKYREGGDLYLRVTEASEPTPPDVPEPS
jgi:hypothetical protein